MLARLRDWVLDRSTLNPEMFRAAERGVPRGVGWWQTLGYAAALLMAAQLLSGTLLAFYYSPHPDAAYESLRYVDYQVPMGRLIHGLHHYGSSALIILVALHLLRIYFQGAYKAPRELNWVLGVILLNLLLAFGFTGALLPWDQNAYFGTEVRTGFPAGIPVVGPALQQLIRGGTEIGALTLTRFYALHVLLLPALLVPLVVGHVLLAARKGPTPPGVRVGEEDGKVGASAAQQRLRNASAMLVALGIVYLFAVLRPVELEFKANPADPTYKPRAEWNFLFLFQFLNDFGKIPLLGRLPDWLPALAVPGIGMTFLALAPWLDRGPERRAARRPLMIGAVVFGLLFMAGFTARAYSLLHPNATPSNSLYGHFTRGGEDDLEPNQVEAGRRAFASARPAPCAACHKAYSDYTVGTSPDLSGYGMKTFLADVPGHPEMQQLSFYERFSKYVRGEIRPPDTKMPSYDAASLSQEDLDAIGAYISQSPTRVETHLHGNPRTN